MVFVDLLKEVLTHHDQLPSPKQPLSPLKKFNKVAPLNDKKSAVASLDSPLLTATKPVTMDTNGSLDNNDDSNNRVHVIANPNADTDSTSENEPTPSS